MVVSIDIRGLVKISTDFSLFYTVEKIFLVIHNLRNRMKHSSASLVMILTTSMPTKVVGLGGSCGSCVHVFMCSRRGQGEIVPLSGHATSPPLLAPSFLS